MTLREAVFAATPPALLGPLRKLRDRMAQGRYQRTQTPFSLGYHIYRSRFLTFIALHPVTLDLFRARSSLPVDYGLGVDERCIEYPWALSRLAALGRRVLDAGSVLNNTLILDQPAFRDKTVHIVTLAPESECHWRRGVGYLYEDLRDLPLRDDFYDAILCLSTLEHIGLDNSYITTNAAHREDAPDTFQQAMSELARVLRRGGTLLLSVPYGRYQVFGTFQQFDRTLLDQALIAFGPARVEETFYRYTDAGWALSTADACADALYECRFWNGVREAATTQPVPQDSRTAAAARAVACVSLTKL